MVFSFRTGQPQRQKNVTLYADGFNKCDGAMAR